MKYAGGQYPKRVLEVRNFVHLRPIAVSVFGMPLFDCTPFPSMFRCLQFS